MSIISDLRDIRNALWDIDIPHPTVPEYIEHHKQVQGVLGIVDNKIAKYENMKLHLCESCSKSYPVCDGEPEFGNGVCDDNVIKCDGYEMRGDEIWVLI